MIKCDVCGKECKDTNGLKIHRRFHFLTEDEKVRLHRIRQEAHKKALNTLKTTIKDGKTLFQLSREKARNTMMKKDENGLNGYQRGTRKIVETRRKNDSYRTGSIKAKNTMLAKNVDGKNGYQLLIEKVLNTKANQIFEDGTNGFQHETKKAIKTVQEKYNVNNARCLGRRPSNCYSKISLKLFSDIFGSLLESLIDSTYWYGFNGEKKFQVGPNKYIYIDFIIDDIKLAIEFNGDYWHANPKFYKASDIIKRPGGKTVKVSDIWNWDAFRKEFLEFNGYKLITIWEDDYRKNPEFVLEYCLEQIAERIWNDK